ncbi:MAG: hypothetical protein KDE31_21995, partial [Caldilineaceae bacterium]|nr:hypothetical protein [Caldilineaceae bacterium]
MMWAGTLEVTVDEQPVAAFCTDLVHSIDADCYPDIAAGPPDPLVACALQYYPPEMNLSDTEAAARQATIWHFTDDMTLHGPSDVKALYDVYVADVLAKQAAGACDAYLTPALTIAPESAINTLVPDGEEGYLDSPHEYTLQLLKGALPIPNTVVTVSTDLGTLSNGVVTDTTVVVTTDINGEAKVTVSHDAPGTATISATTVVSMFVGLEMNPGSEIQNLSTTSYGSFPAEATATKEWQVAPDPGIEIEKHTNGNDADDGDGADVPEIAIGDTVTWTYYVTNTGNVTFTQAQVTVTDSVEGVNPLLDTSSDDGDLLLSPGEMWVYVATGISVDLLTPPAIEGFTVVSGCSADDTSVYGKRATYENIGAVEVPGDSDDDPSHYCNPPEPGIAIKKYTNGADADDANGADVPKIVSNGAIEWTYVVSNTGNVSFPKNTVIVTDNRKDVPSADSVVP